MLALSLLLSLFSKSVDQTRYETNKNGGDGPEVDGSIEEDQTGQSNWQLVQGTHHRVGGGGGDTHTPSRTVRDSDRGSTRDQNGNEGSVSVLSWEVQSKVSRAPVLKHEGGNQQNWNGQQVVVEHGVEVLEVGQLDTDSHEQNKSSGCETVAEHPEVSQVQRVQVISTLGGSRVTVGGKDRGEDHQKEGTQGHGSDGATKPQDLTVSNQNDSQVLENGVNWNRQKFQSLGRGVDHGDKQESNRHPLLSLIRVERAVVDDAQSLQSTDGSNTDSTLNCQQEEVQVEGVARKDVLVGDGHKNRGHTVTGDRQRTGVGDGGRGTAQRRVCGLIHFSFDVVNDLRYKKSQKNSHTLESREL